MPLVCVVPWIFYAVTCLHKACMCLHVFSTQINLCVRTFSMPACVFLYVCAWVLRSSFDLCSPHMCSRYTARCSGWSRSGCAALATVPFAAVQPGLSPPCQPSSRPRNSWWSDGCPQYLSHAIPTSLAWGKRKTLNESKDIQVRRIRVFRFLKRLCLRAIFCYF